MEKLLFVLTLLITTSYVSAKPIIVCHSNGDLSNPIKIELSGKNAGGKTVDILRDSAGNIIELSGNHDRRLTWDTVIMEGHAQMHFSIEDKIASLKEVKTNKLIGQEAPFDCSNVDEALVHEALNPELKVERKEVISDNDRITAKIQKDPTINYSPKDDSDESRVSSK